MRRIRSLRTRLICQTALPFALMTLVAGCSSDFSRFDHGVTTASVAKGRATNNQVAIVRKAPTAQPYPGDVDPITTASTSAARSGVVNATGNVRRYPTGNLRRSGTVIQDNLTPAQIAAAEGEGVPRPTGVIQQRVQRTTAKPRSLLPSRGVDRSITTGSIPKPYVPQQAQLRANQPVTANTAANATPVKGRSGWTNVGGTYVTLQKGEGLNNLSRRYGVPVTEIRKANNFSNNQELREGQKVLIPVYTYSRNTNVSAPDSDAGARAARSSTGNQGEIVRGRVAVPRKRPQVAIVKRDPITTGSVKRAKRTSSARQHTVVAGDTLSKISRTYGISISDIRAANGLKGDNIRLGQKLRIEPGAGGGTRVAAARTQGNTVDPIVTGTAGTKSRKASKVAKSKSRKATYTSPETSAEIARRASEKTTAPKQTGIDRFRWPVRGRIISRFGSKQGGQTNDGIDISVPVGTAVKAAENGKVIYSGSELEEFGNLILVRHANGWVSAYAHTSRNLVKRGDTVKRGQTIAKSGRTGKAKRPKLHFELRKNSNPVNPVKHLGRG
ncbi:MAG: peptidoglycan DD-metalloendopeptidase family protein [Pseudomonadota bacterium]